MVARNLRVLALAAALAAPLLLTPASATAQGWQLSVQLGDGFIHVVHGNGGRSLFRRTTRPAVRAHHVHHVHHFHHGVQPPPPKTCVDLAVMIRLARIGNLEPSMTAEMTSVQPIVCSNPNAELERWPGGQRATSLTKAWYYPNGERARSITGTLYYPNGERARSSTGTWYYPNGERAHRGDGAWFAPDGTRVGQLRNGVTGAPQALIRVMVLERLWTAAGGP